LLKRAVKILFQFLLFHEIFTVQPKLFFILRVVAEYVKLYVDKQTDKDGSFSVHNMLN